ncbi:MAG: anti-sigma B factor antagonist [Phenylobacterium sp.]|jgi:anti-sigma B factor antagonist
MSIMQTISNDQLKITIRGRFDARFIQAERETLDKLAGRVRGTILFDLSSADFIDSSGIGFLVYIYKRIKPQNRSMAIIGLNGQPKSTVEMLNIHRLINCFDNEIAFNQQPAPKVPGSRRAALKKMAKSRIFIKRKEVANS